MTTQTKEFIAYVIPFYGIGGIYRFDCGHDTLREVCEVVATRRNFAGDSVDRELVRATLEAAGYRELPTAADVLAARTNGATDMLGQDPSAYERLEEVNRDYAYLSAYGEEREARPLSSLKQTGFTLDDIQHPLDPFATAV